MTSDRNLVRLHWPAELRPAFDALLDIDAALGDVVARSTQPALAAVKLAWWREGLEGLDSGQRAAEPRLQAAAAELLPRGIAGAELAALADGWAALLDEQPDLGQAIERGPKLFAIAARLLGGSDRKLPSAGRLYACQQVARRGHSVADRAVDQARELRGYRFAASVRPVTALARLAARDAKRGSEPEDEATPGRALALIAHRLTGRVA
jgi:phytoene synthase